MSDQVNTQGKNDTGPIESILDGEMTSYINSFIDQNAGKIVAAAEEKARLAAQRIIDKAREKAEAEIDRIILDSKAEMDKSAEQTIREAEEKVSWFVLEVSAHVTEEAQAMKKEIVNKLVEKKSSQIVARAEEKARSAAQQIVAKARERAEAEARRIVERAKEAADKSVQEIAQGADDEAARMVIEVKDVEGTGSQLGKEETGEQQPSAVSEFIEKGPETAERNVPEVAQVISVEAAPTVAEVETAAVAEKRPEDKDVEKQAVVGSESVGGVVGEAKKDSPEMVKEADSEAPAALVQAEDKAKGRVIEFVSEDNGDKSKAAELAKEELAPVAPSPPESAAPVQESTVAQKPEEPLSTLGEGDNEDFVLYKDLVQLTLPPPIALDHMLKLHKQLKNTPNVKVMELTGSLDKGVKIELFLTTPVPLIGVLKAIPEVEKALDLDEKKLVPAGRQKGSELTPHAIVIKMKK